VPFRDRGPELEDEGQQLRRQADKKPLENQLRLRPAGFSGDEHLGGGGSLGVRQPAVLLDDQVAAERDHHEDAEDSAA
jgi:hypothetical protein